MSASNVNADIVAALGPFPTKDAQGNVTVSTTTILKNLYVTSCGGSETNDGVNVQALLLTLTGSI